MSLICSVVGARPNFMKMAPPFLELRRRGLRQVLVHTGQHYDKNMSDVFFQELGMPEPDIHLNVGSGTHARQTARVMEAFEEVCTELRPDLVMVGGDVNSTAAVAMVAAKLGIGLAHVESGLRSFDRTMPEEINRIVTDHLSDLLFTTEQSANENLWKEGISKDRVHFVGNCMVDTLLRHVEHARRCAPWETLGLEESSYALVTLHRPSNVDDAEVMSSLINVIEELSRTLPIIFPVHPRTQRRLDDLGLDCKGQVHLTGPLPYLSFIGLISAARIVLTDSGGIQEETTALGIPCLTLRENTERPVTVTSGTNRVVGREAGKILEAAREELCCVAKSRTAPLLWDGLASRRLVDVVEGWISSGSRAPSLCYT